MLTESPDPRPAGSVEESLSAALREAAQRYESLIRDLSCLRRLDECDDPKLSFEDKCCGLLGVVASETAAENYSIMLLDPSSKLLEVRAAGSPFESEVRAYRRGRPEGAKFELGQGVVGRVAQTGLHVRMEDVTGEKDFVTHPDARIRFRSLVSFPIRAAGETIGVLNLSHPDPGFFTRDMENGLAMMADRIGHILHTHELHLDLRRSAENYRLICENAGDGILLFDSGLKIVDANPASGNLFGTSPDALIKGGIPWDESKSEADRDRLTKHLQETLGQERSLTVEYEFVRADGEHLYLEQRSAPLLDESGECTGLAAVIRDLTERRNAWEEKQRLEAQLLQTQKMDAIGRLAGGIAHDFNNLLTGILGYSSMLQEQIESPEAVRKAASIIERAAERAAELTRQLLGFAREGKHQEVDVRIHEIVHEVIDLISRTIPKNIEISEDLGARRSVVSGDPAQFQQVLLNLAINAADAMADGGRLVFRTRNLEFEQETDWGGERVSPGSYLTIEVEDEGTGISDEIREKIFEPFFTTKEVGRGTGMGLAMVYGIIKNHSGHIRVVKREIGTRFEILLPRLVDAESQRKSEASGDRNGRTQACVLIVDDEDLVRTVTSSILEHMECSVISAANGDAATKIFNDRHSEIDLVLIDMIMPEMNGIECYHRLRAIDPGIKALLMSGYNENEDARKAIESGVVGFVQKPFSHTQLAEAVSLALDADG